MSLAQNLICLIQINLKGPVIIPTHQNKKIITDTIPSSVKTTKQLNAGRPKTKFIVKSFNDHTKSTRMTRTHI